MKSTVSLRLEVMDIPAIAASILPDTTAGGLPEDLKSNLVSEITNCAQKSQKSLDESAKRDLSGELKRIILSYRIDNI